MNKERIKGFILGVLVTVVIFASVIIAAANSETFTKQITYGINVMVNGEQAEFDDDMRPFVMDNRTFLPLRGIGELLGLFVDYDADTHTAIVGEMPIPDTITIKGVEYSTNLTRLHLIDIELIDTDIEALKYMINLTILLLDRHNINDISVLSNLINLTGLSLVDNEINDINALSGLINLTALDLTANDINDISVLSNLINLNSLSLIDNNVSDISALSGLVNLDVLYLAKNPLTEEQIAELQAALPDCEIYF